MTTLEKEDIKQALRELIREDKGIFKAILKEVIEDELKAAEPNRRTKIEAIIRQDFERYKNVFKALA